jgi:glycosyltransferase involved in cell wall biosynthesis
MDIVFIHGNYPAQFRHLAAALGQAREHRVFFLTAREDAETQPIPGVAIRRFELHRTPHTGTHHYLIATEEAVLKGQAVLRALHALIAEGVQPRLVVCHGGMGLGLFVKDFLPNAVHIGLFEWYFRPATARWLMPNFELNQQLLTRMRNLPILEELESCDLGVVPTNWQRQQFPQEFQNKLAVIFDGIDQSFFQPDPEIDERIVVLEGEDLPEPLRIEPGQTVLSYATRGMEPLRGFPEFLQAAAVCLAENENLQVVVAGRDVRAYSYGAPSHEGSWKQHLLNELGKFTGRERLHFCGLMPYVHYRQLLQRSNLHCYFTRPYVTSWSLFEAAACGARLCVNQCPATEGVVADPAMVAWVDLDDASSLRQTLQTRLRSGAPRSSMDARHSLQLSLQHWQTVVNEALNQSS